MSKLSLIAVDIGGTRIKGSVVCSATTPPLHPDISLLTDHSSNADNVLKQIKYLVNSLIDDAKNGHRFGNLSGISVSSPGFVDSNTGKVLISLNLPGWSNIPLGEILAEHFALPVLVENDARASALGEWHYIYKREIDNLIFVTVSTGIGSGIIQNGKLITGKSGAAGELGHMSVDYTGAICHECKRGRGCLTTLASGTAILQFAKTNLAPEKAPFLWRFCNGEKNTISGEMIAKSAEIGDTIAVEAYERAGKALGQGLVNIIHLINPDLIVLGGGVLKAGNIILKPLIETVHSRLIDIKQADVIRQTKLGEAHGIAGAAVNGILRWNLG